METRITGAPRKPPDREARRPGTQDSTAIEKTIYEKAFAHHSP